MNKENILHKIILTRGIQGSGKSTYAKKWVEEDPNNRVRWNNDSFRKMCGKYWIPSREKFIKSNKYNFIVSAIDNKYDIIIDDMNMTDDLVKYLTNYLSSLKITDYQIIIEDKFLKVPLSECLYNNYKRIGDNYIDNSVVIATFNRYKDKYNLIK